MVFGSNVNELFYKMNLGGGCWSLDIAIKAKALDPVRYSWGDGSVMLSSTDHPLRTQG